MKSPTVKTPWHLDCAKDVWSRGASRNALYKSLCAQKYTVKNSNISLGCMDSSPLPFQSKYTNEKKNTQNKMAADADRDTKQRSGKCQL